MTIANGTRFGHYEVTAPLGKGGMGEVCLAEDTRFDLARATMLQGDTAKAQQSYQAFFAPWKDADADLPVLIEAKKGFEKLK
jgi:serine/threonine protein kinase